MAVALIDYYCHFDTALKRHLLCAEFYFAKVAREIIPNYILQCWEIPGTLSRYMSYQARYYAEQRGAYEDHTGDPYGWHDCPFCGGETEPLPAKVLPRGDATGGGE